MAFIDNMGGGYYHPGSNVARLRKIFAGMPSSGDWRKRFSGIPGVTPHWPGTAAPGAGGGAGPPASSGDYPKYAEPPDDYWGTASSRVHGIYDPILNILNTRQASDEAARRADAANWSSQIEDIYSKARAPVAANYNEAIKSETDLNEAVSQHLAGASAGAVGDLGSKLAAINAPGAATTTGEIASQYQGANAADFASGSADVGALIRRKAEAQNFLEQEHVQTAGQVGKELVRSINDIAKEYGIKRDDIVAQLPAQIQDMYDNLSSKGHQQALDKYDRDVDKWKSAQESAIDKRNFNYQKQQDILNRRADEKKVALETKLTNKKTMSDSAYKKWAKNFDANEKAKDRQARLDIANLGNEASAARGQTLTGPPNQRYVTGSDGKVYENPNYDPKAGKGGGSSGSQGRLKRNRATTMLDRQFLNPDTMMPRDRWRPAANPKQRMEQAKSAASQIDAALNKAGVKDPATRLRLRKTYMNQMGFKSGPRGYPVAQ